MPRGVGSIGRWAFAWALAGAIGLVAVASGSRADDDARLEANYLGASVYARPTHRSTVIGSFAPGGRIRVRSCGPHCPGRADVVAVEPMGFVFRDELRAARDREERPTSYARVVRWAPVFAVPDERTTAPRRLLAGYTISVFADTLGLPLVERVNGGFVRSRDLQPHSPSSHSGVVDPRETVAFERTIDGSIVRRTAIARPRPAGVPAAAFWVHVDREEQVLTAYEGDRWVFATVVTTGNDAHPTPSGIFRVYQKTRFQTMRGDEGEYRVEEVPFTMFFRNDFALHAAPWHDRFGARGSHGCVNLAPADAEHLFAWAPPHLPDGWTTIMPRDAALDSLWVVVE